MKAGGLSVLLLIAACTVPVYSALANAPEVGEIIHIKGKASRRAADGTGQSLNKGDSVFEGDLIETRRNSVLTIQFKDETHFSLGSRAAFKIDKFKYDEGEDDEIATEVVQGAFRFVTGLLAKLKPRSMRVRTGAVATIGIRGTTVGGEVEGESATIVLLESEEPGTPSAIEVGNAHGSVVIEEPGYGTEVPDANSPPTPPRRMRLRTIDNLTRNIQSIQRVNVPRPRYP
jgi:hypothetical protein